MRVKTRWLAVGQLVNHEGLSHRVIALKWRNRPSYSTYEVTFACCSVVSKKRSWTVAKVPTCLGCLTA